MPKYDSGKSEPTTCADCGGVLEEGFIPDRSRGIEVAETLWQEGQPQVSGWTGVRLKKSPFYYVRAFRCSDCGLLRMYAHKKLWNPVAVEAE